VNTIAPSLADRFAEILEGIRCALAVQDTAKHPTTIGPLLGLISAGRANYVVVVT
jgi:hypothetical protein